ncbi:MAG TPA: hypothetical protein VF868_07270 [Bacteroidia bacterium]|jgi:hypothetical protein
MSQQIAWTNTIAYSLANSIAGMAQDGQGNIYVAGDFSDSDAQFYGVFIKKYNSMGTLIWEDTTQCVQSKIISISIEQGSLYISGYYGALGQTSQIKFGSITLTKPDSIANNGYIVKYDLSGNVLWANQLYGAGGKVEAIGNSVYLTGGINDWSPPTDPYSGGFVAKYESTSGALAWVQNVYSHPGDFIKGFGNTIFVKHGKSYTGGTKIDLFDTLGTQVWSRSTGTGYVWELATDSYGNCYLIAYGGSGFVIKKINQFGADDWNTYNDSSSLYNAYVQNDTIYTCGMTKDFTGTPSARNSSVILYNSSTGQILQSSEYDITPGYPDQADFILPNDEGLYIAGKGGSQGSVVYISKIAYLEPTVVNDIQSQNDIILFPNPAINGFTISGNLQQNVKSLNIVLKSSTGQIVYRKNLQNVCGECYT